MCFKVTSALYLLVSNGNRILLTQNFLSQRVKTPANQGATFRYINLYWFPMATE